MFNVGEVTPEYGDVLVNVITELLAGSSQYHWYVGLPDAVAVKVAEVPSQMGPVPETDSVGVEFTVSVTLAGV